MKGEPTLQDLLKLVTEIKDSQAKHAKQLREHRRRVGRRMIAIEGSVQRMDESVRRLHEAVGDLSRDVGGLRAEMDQFAASQETHHDYLTRLAVAMNALVDDHVKLEARVTRLEQKSA